MLSYWLAGLATRSQSKNSTNVLGCTMIVFLQPKRNACGMGFIFSTTAAAAASVLFGTTIYVFFVSFTRGDRTVNSNESKLGNDGESQKEAFTKDHPDGKTVKPFPWEAVAASSNHKFSGDGNDKPAREKHLIRTIAKDRGKNSIEEKRVATPLPHHANTTTDEEIEQQQQLEFLASMSFANGFGMRAPSCLCCQ